MINAQAIAEALGGKPNGSGWMCLCPAHDDSNPSLSVTPNTNGGAPLVHCHAGCSGQAVVDALRARGLWPDRKDDFNIVAEYDYHDPHGKMVYQVVRLEPKSFRQRRPDGAGCWVWKMAGVQLYPYRLPQVMQADFVFIAEGEKDCDRLAAMGVPATTNPGGAGKWPPHFNQYFEGKDVYIIPDNDQPGRNHASQVARSLHGAANAVVVLELPGLPEKGDVSDWIRAGGTAEALGQMAAEAPAWEPEASPTAGEEWPTLAPEAFYGPAGEFVRLVEPHTESDPAALLLQFLIGFGNVIGKEAYALVEADTHWCNLFGVAVGETAKGRKGTSWGHAKRPLLAMDPTWEARVRSGLSSGEGLIQQVRDAVWKTTAKKKDGEVVSEEVMTDQGEDDKRLLVVEPEFANVLRQFGREGNILSVVIRDSWDKGDLATLTKNNPTRATGAHVSIIGHITKDELRRYLTRTEAGNGFGNRILWFCVKRSKVLPEGGSLYGVDFAPFFARLHGIGLFARSAGEVGRDEGARALWAGVYPGLSEGKPGMLGAMTSRAEAQVLRLGMIYALLDGVSVVGRAHLKAALAVWDYCEASVRHVFGDSLGDPVADDILAALKANQDGLSRTEVYNLFGAHRRADSIQRAIGELMARGLISVETTETGGRPRETLRYTGI